MNRRGAKGCRGALVVVAYHDGDSIVEAFLPGRAVQRQFYHECLIALGLDVLNQWNKDPRGALSGSEDHDTVPGREVVFAGTRCDIEHPGADDETCLIRVETHQIDLHCRITLAYGNLAYGESDRILRQFRFELPLVVVFEHETDCCKCDRCRIGLTNPKRGHLVGLVALI